MEYPAYKALSGGLSATFNLDGQHLARYVARREEVLDQLFEDLVLHDQVRIPTQDFLTAAGLVTCLGETIVLRLLEDNSLRFVRISGSFGYVRGTGKDGSLGVFRGSSREGVPKPQSADLEQAIDAGVAAITGKLDSPEKLRKLIARQTDEYTWEAILSAVRRESHRDLKQTELWKDRYSDRNPDALRLPSMKKMQVKVLGPDASQDIQHDVVARLLAITLWNAELHLAEKENCASLSSSSPMGALLVRKSERAFGRENASNLLLHLNEINRVPWLAPVIFNDMKAFDQFMDMHAGGNGRSFREWFHSCKTVSPKEFTARYIDLLQATPTASTKLAKTIRFVVTYLLKEVPIVGTVVSFVDKFFIDKAAQMPSPKLFVADLKKFGGSPTLKSS